jgi:hypothetical protein
LVPVKVTVAPAAADEGEMAVMVGAGMAKPAKLPVPKGVVTEILPDDPLLFTTALMLVALLTT